MFCSKCHKKINVILVLSGVNMKCKCGNIYCRKHLTSHKCTWNWREEREKELRAKIEKKNNKIEFI